MMERKKVLGLDRVIHFFSIGAGVRSSTLVSSDDWQSLKESGIVAAGAAGNEMLKVPVEQAAEDFARRDFGGNPHPVVTIDEFGFDYGGQIDIRTAETLRAIKKARPELGLVVWQMRGPVGPKLAEAYGEVVELVMLETYVSPANIWLIGAQIKAAELSGLGHMSIVGLGAGKCARDNIPWALTKEEMEEQIRFTRLVAPDSPGLALFAVQGNMKDQPITVEEIDEICSRWDEIPTDGTGLRPEFVQLAKAFTKRYEKPAIVCSSLWVHPNRRVDDWRKVVRPVTFRAFMMNLGEEEAKGVKVTLRNPEDRGGNVLARGVVDIAAKSTAVAVLPKVGDWKEWKLRWDMELETAYFCQLEIEAPGCEVLSFSWAGPLWE